MSPQLTVTFLGTAAANAFPEAFCDCRNCNQARLLGGPSLRKRSSVLINSDLLIDLGPDIMTASQMHGCSLRNVRYCLQTHPHADHLDLSHLLSRSPAYGVVGAPVLEFYASRETLTRAAETFRRDLADYNLFSPEAEKYLNIRIHEVLAFKRFVVGPYWVTAFPANHAPGLGAMLYAIEAFEHAVFYGTDTAMLPEKTWEAIQKRSRRFDLVILDHTYGPEQAGSDHLSANQLIACARRMRTEGLIDSKGRVFATHIAHEGNPAHPDLTAFATRHGYEVAFDGLIVQI
jgi:phosphoribosyl 1,2-cyclic phosphodiesterase